MAAASLLVRQAVARGVDVAVVQLVDRRQDPPGDAQEWTFQRDVEAVLYGNGYAQTTGAVYRLLQRSGVVRDSLALKKTCVQQGIVTQDEFDCLRGYMGDVRSFTLVPLVALRTALSVFGRDERSEALVAALGMDRPADWPEAEAEEEGEENDDDDEEEGGDEDEGGDGGEGGDEDEEGDAWSFKDRATATRRLAAAWTARSRGAQATWPMCHNDDNSALRGPSKLWHGSETRLGPCTNSDRARQ
jgi:hypothetical protein